MPVANEEIEATFIAERYRFENADGDVCIGTAILANGSRSDRLPSEVTIKGPWDRDELRANQTYRFYGRWQEYQRRGVGKELQFHFSSFVPTVPAGREGIIAYLRLAGAGNGIGTGRAIKIWNMFGSDSVRELRTNPDRVAAGIPGLDVDQARAAAEWLEREKRFEESSIAMANLLAGKGFPRGTARAAIKQWGAKAAATVSRNPYALMRFRGCGFLRTDHLWLELKRPPGQLRRQSLCCWHAVSTDSNGHTWFPVQEIMHGLAQLVGTTELRPAQALQMCKRIGLRNSDAAGALSFLRTDDSGMLVSAGGKVWAAQSRKAWCENRIAELLVDSANEQSSWPDLEDIEGISPHQLEQLKLATREPIGVLGGGPGTGKTYTAAKLIQHLAQQLGEGAIAVGAPTGKAAVRITEVMNAHGLKIVARTWHSLLGIAEGSMDGGWSFQHCETDPLPFKLLIGDECSMCDTNLMSAILRARAPGTKLLLIGDVNQLPPVGHGAPLRDMIAAGIPHGELTEIKRNSGGIVETCAAIRRGEKWSAGGNLLVCHAIDPDQVLKSLTQVIAEQVAMGLDPIWDIQVVVPVNDKSPVSRKVVNRLLQQELNVNSRNTTARHYFAERDKVVNTKNGFFRSHVSEDCQGDDEAIERNQNGDIFIANGELGEIIAVQDKGLVVRVCSPNRIVFVPRGKTAEPAEGESTGEESVSTGCSFELGYALSVHKSQGSEFKAVIALVDEYPGARRICSREYWYTAISRAKGTCILIGKKSTVESGCRRVAIWDRKTMLKELIQQKNARRLLEQL